MTERREKDGRPARGKAPKKRYQEIRNSRGELVGVRTQWTDPATKRRRTIRTKTVEELFATVSELERVRRNAALGLLEFRAIDKAIGAATKRGTPFRDWFERWRTSGVLSRSWRRKVDGIWRYHVAPKLGSLCLHELTGEVMADWASWLGERSARADHPIAPKTIENIWHCVRAAVNYAVSAGELSALPWGAFTIKRAESAKRRTAVAISRKGGFRTPDELARAYEVARAMALRAEITSGDVPDLHRRLAIGALCGFRRGEGIALSWAHVRRLPSGGVELDVRHAAREGWRNELGPDARPVADPKAGSVGLLFLEPGNAVIRLLEEQRAVLQHRGFYRSDGPVFPDKHGRFRARNLIRPETVRAIVGRAGLLDPTRKWDQHSLRHSAIRMSISAGATLDEVMALARHKDPTVTRVYFKDMGDGATIPAGAAAARALPFEDDERAPLDVSLLVADTQETPSSGTAPARLPAGGDAFWDPARLHAERARRYHEKHLGRRVFPMNEHIDLTTEKMPRAVVEEGHRKYREAYKNALRRGLTKEEALREARAQKARIRGQYFRRRSEALRALAPPIESLPEMKQEALADEPAKVVELDKVRAKRKRA